jgi:GH25 family lysozyme M1 (1,4-beta-N-acetylmuramidase)
MVIALKSRYPSSVSSELQTPSGALSQCFAVPGVKMKRNQSNNHRPLLHVLGTAVLATALVAGPGLAGVAFAVDSSPTQAPLSTLAPTTSPSPSPAVSTAGATPAATGPAPSAPPASTTAPSSASVPSATNEAMAQAIGVGGAEMGQRSKRVTASSPSASIQKLQTESLSTEGTWMPTFGVPGLDVSGHQPNVDWQQQWNMGARFAYVKASEGNYFTNDQFNSQYQGSRNVGMIRGAYHFAIPNWSSGADQARYFVANGGGWSADGYTMPPVLDFEFNPYEGRTINGFYFGNTCYGMSPAQLGSWVRDFGNTMLSMTGRLPVIYTNTNWWNQCLGNPSGFGDYPLWVAAYPGSPTNNAGAVPTGSWSTYSIWQYSSTGPLAGDSNVWNGDSASLAVFAGSRPAGSFDSATIERTDTTTALRLRGWALDSALSGATTEVHAYVSSPNGSTVLHTMPATAYRPDVNRVMGLGDFHGFDKQVPVGVSGTYNACLYAIGKFTNVFLGCKSALVEGAERPIGNLDAVLEERAPTKVTVKAKGWAVDMSKQAAVSEVSADLYGPGGSKTSYRVSAQDLRPDVDQFLGVGSNHGFHIEIEVKKAGDYRLCAVAQGLFLKSDLGCKTLKIESAPSPIGALDPISVKKTKTQAFVSVRGWTVDYGDTASQVAVHVYVYAPDGSSKLVPISTSTTRTDVNQFLGITGVHGYEQDITVSTPGNYAICSYGIALSPVSTGNSALGCRTVNVGFAASPVGFLDSATVQISGGVASLAATGWAVDRDVSDLSIDLHTYITAPDGTVTNFSTIANLPRLDVNQILGITGNHGYTSKKVITQRGRYTVCTYGIAASPFTLGNALLGCQNITY